MAQRTFTGLDYTRRNTVCCLIEDENGKLKRSLELIDTTYFARPLSLNEPEAFLLLPKEHDMSENKVEIKLQDGTLIRHKVAGYEGRIEGTTQIKSCFTRGGELLAHPTTKELFQYRVMVEGESLRRIAPAEDFEILDGVVEVICSKCDGSFQSRPELAGKPRGRCLCGGWICPP